MPQFGTRRFPGRAPDRDTAIFAGSGLPDPASDDGQAAPMTALPLPDLLLLLLALTAAGLVGGLVAGLFGVGGGTVIVPAVFYAFEVLGVGGEGNLHTAIGTSLLTIVATSWRSLRAHRAHGAGGGQGWCGLHPAAAA